LGVWQPLKPFLRLVVFILVQLSNIKNILDSTVYSLQSKVYVHSASSCNHRVYPTNSPSKFLWWPLSSSDSCCTFFQFSEVFRLAVAKFKQPPWN